MAQPLLSPPHLRGLMTLNRAWLWPQIPQHDEVVWRCNGPKAGISDVPNRGRCRKYPQLLRSGPTPRSYSLGSSSTITTRVMPSVAFFADI